VCDRPGGRACAAPVGTQRRRSLDNLDPGQSVVTGEQPHDAEQLSGADAARRWRRDARRGRHVQHVQVDAEVDRLHVRHRVECPVGCVDGVLADLLGGDDLPALLAEVLGLRGGRLEVPRADDREGIQPLREQTAIGGDAGWLPVDGQPSSVTSYRRLLSEGLDALAVVGARHFETATAEAEYLREQGGEIVTAEEVGEDAVDAADRALDAVADVESVYLSIDLDVLDVTAAPGVSTPTPGGISTRELFRIVRLLASDDRLAGVEIVETAPSLCPDGRSARAAARTVAHALSVAGR